MGEAIVITSGKGGVGKSTLSANVGYALAMSGHKTLLIDTDIGLRNLDIILGMEDRIVYDIVDVCEGECDITKAAIRDKTNENLYLIPASQAKDKDAVTKMQMKTVINKAKECFDYVLIDCPAGIENGAENAIAGADKAIVVTLCEKTSLRDADRIMGVLEKHGITDVRIVINRINKRLIKRGVMPSIEEILDLLAADLLGAVPEDDNIIISSNTDRISVTDEKAPSSIAFKNIALRITGEKAELADLLSEENVFVRIWKAILNK